MPAARLLRIVLFIAGPAAALAGGAGTAAAAGLRPSAAFVQASSGPATDGLTAGVTWQWPWQRRLGAAMVVGYSELSLGRWRSDAAQPGDAARSAWVTQFGLTPVLRLQSAEAAAWFAEAGLGAHVIAPIYRSERKRFSTNFNFAEHLAVGRRFGATGAHELSLRFQHFSNGGIRQPNPGENFVELRYGWRLD